MTLLSFQSTVNYFPTVYTSLTERLYCHCMQPDIGERMKDSDRCKNWFLQHCEHFERTSSTTINLRQWYCSSCDRTPLVHINPLLYLALDKLFMELCITDEKMHLTLSLLCKKWKSFAKVARMVNLKLAFIDQFFIIW